MNVDLPVKGAACDAQRAEGLSVSLACIPAKDCQSITTIRRINLSLIAGNSHIRILHIDTGIASDGTVFDLQRLHPLVRIINNIILFIANPKGLTFFVIFINSNCTIRNGVR